jgi:hypothetical protein
MESNVQKKNPPRRQMPQLSQWRVQKRRYRREDPTNYTEQDVLGPKSRGAIPLG